LSPLRQLLITFGLTVNTERHLRGVRVRTDGSKLLKIQSDEVFGTDTCASEGFYKEKEGKRYAQAGGVEPE